MRLAKRVLAFGMGMVLFFSGCAPKKTITADFNSTTNQILEFEDIRYEVPGSWSVRGGSDENRYYYPDGGMLMVQQQDMEGFVSLCKGSEAEKDAYIEGMAKGMESMELESTEFMEINGNQWMILNVKGQYKGGDIVANLNKVAIVDANDNSYSFSIAEYDGKELDFSEDFTKIIESVSILEKKTDYTLKALELFDGGIPGKVDGFDITADDLEGVVNDLVLGMGNEKGFAFNRTFQVDGKGETAHVFDIDKGSKSFIIVTTKQGEGYVTGVILTGDIETFHTQLREYVVVFLTLFFAEAETKDIVSQLQLGEVQDMESKIYVGANGFAGNTIQNGSGYVQILPNI